MIIGIILKNFKCYKGINYIPLTNVEGSRFCGLIGLKGVGKSAVLEALDCFFNNKEWIEYVETDQKSYSHYDDDDDGKESSYIIPIFSVSYDDEFANLYAKTVIDYLNKQIPTSKRFEYYDVWNKIREHYQLIPKDDNLILPLGITKYGNHPAELFVDIFENINKINVHSEEESFGDLQRMYFSILQRLSELLGIIKSFYSYIYIPKDIITEKFLKFGTKEIQRLIGLNLSEYRDDELIFDKSNIHKNFKLFIIYNPLSHGAQKVDQTLYNNCIKFTLPSIDYEQKDIITLLYKNIYDSKDNCLLWSDLCGRLASYHINQVQKSLNNNDNISGNAIFNSRILIFIFKDYNKVYKNNEKPEIEEWLKLVFDIYYWRSYISYDNYKRNEFMEEAYNIIKKKPEEKYEINEENNFELDEIIEDLIGIQNYATRNIEYNNFSFFIFVRNCLKIPLNKVLIEKICNNIEDTINLLDNNAIMKKEIKSKFYQINIVKDILKNIENNFNSISNIQEMKIIKDNELLNIKDI